MSFFEFRSVPAVVCCCTSKFAVRGPAVVAVANLTVRMSYDGDSNNSGFVSFLLSGPGKIK